MSDADAGRELVRSARVLCPWRAIAVYVLASVAITFPLALSLKSALGAPQGRITDGPQ